jgi:mRNA interferase MazF
MRVDFTQGDIVYLDFDPQAGHEQKGKRPALIISNNTFNKFTTLALVCPIANTNRGFPLHVALDNRTKTSGVIMCEKVKALDIGARNVSFFERVPQDILDEVIDIVISFLE